MYNIRLIHERRTYTDDFENVGGPNKNLDSRKTNDSFYSVQTSLGTCEMNSRMPASRSQLAAVGRKHTFCVSRATFVFARFTRITTCVFLRLLIDV